MAPGWNAEGKMKKMLTAAQYMKNTESKSEII
jgi:hypothetical protein